MSKPTDHPLPLPAIPIGFRSVSGRQVEVALLNELVVGAR
jgi:hypothetical protein